MGQVCRAVAPMFVEVGNRGIDGFSANNFAVQPAFIKYGDKALPSLKKGLTSGRRAVRKHSAIMLGELKSREALNVLLAARKKETDKIVADMMDNYPRLKAK